MVTAARIAIAFLFVMISAVPALARDTFAGLKFGVGLSATFDTGVRDRVDEAQVDANGFVRIVKTSNALARIMLESHYFFESKRRPRVGIGPFIAVQPGSNEIINSVGIGLMFGFRHSTADTTSFNIGIGVSTDPATKTLGDAFKENELAPKGPDGAPLPITYKTVNQKGVLVLASFTWK